MTTSLDTTRVLTYQRSQKGQIEALLTAARYTLHNVFCCAKKVCSTRVFQTKEAVAPHKQDQKWEFYSCSCFKEIIARATCNLTCCSTLTWYSLAFSRGAMFAVPAHCFPVLCTQYGVVVSACALQQATLLSTATRVKNTVNSSQTIKQNIYTLLLLIKCCKSSSLCRSNYSWILKLSQSSAIRLWTEPQLLRLSTASHSSKCLLQVDYDTGILKWLVTAVSIEKKASRPNLQKRNSSSGTYYTHAHPCSQAL